MRYRACTLTPVSFVTSSRESPESLREPRISAPTILVRSKFAVGSSGAALMCPHLSGPPARPHRHPRRGNLWTKLLLPLSKVRLTALMSLHATEDTTSGVPQPL